MLVRLIVTGSLLAVLSACAGQGASPSSSSAAFTAAAETGATAAEAAGPATGTSTGTATLPTSTVGAAPAPAASPAESRAAAGEAPPEPADAGDSTPQLMLEPGGLGVIEDETRVVHLPFGTSASSVRTAVSHLLGPLTTTRRSDCEQGVRTSSATHGFELLFRGSTFVGWTDTGAKGRHLTTGDGIGVGITVRALLHSGTDVTMEHLEGGSGGEWWSSGSGGLYGRSTSTASTGRVTIVSSGENCLGD